MTAAVVLAMQATAVDHNGVPDLIRWFYELPNFAFLLVLIAAMSLEILTCYAHHRRRKRTFHLGRIVVGKFMLLALVAIAALLDYVFINLSPAGFREDLVRLMVVTQSTLVWLILGETLAVVGTVEKMQGSSAVPPVVLWTIRQIRRMDTERYKQFGHDGEEGDEPPRRRIYDRLGEEELETLMAELEARKTKKPIAPPNDHA